MGKWKSKKSGKIVTANILYNAPYVVCMNDAIEEMGWSNNNMIFTRFTVSVKVFKQFYQEIK